MNQKDLVSIIIPCYNCKDYIDRLIGSILSQSYKKLEIIAVNDGSTDSTLPILEDYRRLFSENNIPYRIINQENQGQAMAVLKGFLQAEGEYAIWPDSDDFFSSIYTIEKMVMAFNELDESYKVVRVQSALVDENDLKNIIGYVGKEIPEYDNLFEDCLLQKNNFYFGAGNYMIKLGALFETSEFPFYTKKGCGQNWQILLPILSKYKCKTIPETLYTIVRRKSSHSRREKKFDVVTQQLKVYEETLIETINNIKTFDNALKDKYIHLVRLKYCQLRINKAFDYNNSKAAKKYINQFKILGGHRSFNNLKYWLLKSGLLKYLKVLNSK